MKRIAFANVPTPVLDGTFAEFGWRDRLYTIVDIWRDPRTGVAITVVVDGPTGRTWLSNPETDVRRT